MKHSPQRIISLVLVILLAMTVISCGKTEPASAWQEQYDLGIRYLSEGNYEEAVIAFLAVIEIDPKQVNAYLDLADIYVTMGDIEQALQVLNNALTVLDDQDAIASVEAKIAEVSQETQESTGTNDAINNGGLAVHYNDSYYYWAFAGSIDEPAYTLIKEDSTGTTEELLSSTIRSNIYLLNNIVFVNQRGENYSDIWVERLNDFGEKGTMENVEVVGINKELNQLILAEYVRNTQGYSGGRRYYIYSAIDSDLTAMEAISSNARYLEMGDDVAFFVENTADNAGVILSAYDLGKHIFSEISRAFADYSESLGPGWGSSPCEIYQLQETEQAIYYSYGYQAGSGGFFQPGGGLARVDKSNYDTEIIAEIGDSPNDGWPLFYVFQQDGVEKVLYYSNEIGDIVVTDVEIGETVPSGMFLGALGKPFFEYTNGTQNVNQRCYMYVDMSGEARQILPDMYFGEERLVYIENVSFTGNYVFYELNHQMDNPNPTSWRDGSITFRREMYVYDMATEETRFLCSIE